MHTYMVSPSDAFSHYDTKKIGMLSYQEFTTLVVGLFDCAGQIPPSYPVLKDLFDCIDTKKDGVLDKKEWI